MLEAAERFFGERGFRSASMDEIAQASGVTKALLYEHFDSKEQLYEACVERARARLFDAIEEAVAAAATPDAQLRAFVATYFEQLERHRARWWVLYGEASTDAVNRMRERNAHTIARLLVAGRPRRASAGMEIVAHSLVGAGEQVGRWWLEHPDVPRERATERFAAVCEGIIGTLGKVAR
jgi:AcrR family transcriptional regulator